MRVVRRRGVRHAAMAVAVVGIACGRGGGGVRPAPASEAWAAAISSARELADSGRFARADSVLAAYASAYTQAGEAREAQFFRALFKADPSNRESSARDALALFDAYLAGGTSLPRYAEARVIFRTLQLIETLRDAPRVARSPAERASASPPPISEGRDRPRDEEILRLQAQLDSARQELDRIKRRLRGRP